MAFFWRRKHSLGSNYREEIVTAARRLYDKNILAATDGNISSKEKDYQILITPSGKQKAFLRPEEIILYNMKDKNPKQKVSSELAMHLQIYKSCPKASFVIHAHPPSAIAWTIAFPKLKNLPYDILPELILAVGSIPFVPYARPGTEDMAKNIIPYLPQHKALILTRHGALSWGETMEEAINGMERIEHTAHILMMAKKLRGLTTLPQDEIQYLQEKRKQIGDINL
tara:strand:- start:4129 stop:4806 length:678 start_codon:yes stop_codon:yes gene_type:complete